MCVEDRKARLNLTVVQTNHLLQIDMDIWRRTGWELCWERLNWDILLLWMFGENQWKIIKTLYYIEVLGCLSPLLTIFQLYHSAWSWVLLVEENGKNHRAGFELTTLVVIGTDCTCSWKSNYHMIKMAIFIIILKARNRQYSDYSWSLFF